MTSNSSPYGLLSRLGVLLSAVAVGAAACTGDAVTDRSPERSYRYTRFAMDTVVEYTIRAPSREQAFMAMLSAHEEMQRIEDLLWEKHPGSAIHSLNQGVALSGIPVETQGEVVAFLERLRSYHHQTGGYFDPGIGGVLDLYGFGTDEMMVPDPEHLRHVLAHSGMDRIPEDPAAKYSVGGVVKGYAVDRAVDALRRAGIRNALVNAGGDLFALGSSGGHPWAIGVTHPGNPGALIDTLFVTNAAVATSGDYQRFFEVDGIRYHHLLDPSTGTPARSVRSATIVASTAEKADALATGFFVAGHDAGRKFLDADMEASGMVVDSGFRQLFTAGFDRYMTAGKAPGG